MGNLNTVDYVVLGLLVLGGIGGAIKGFLEELSQKFGLIVGLVASLMFTQTLTPIIEDALSLPLWASTGISYVVIFIAGYLLMKIVGSILQAIFKSSNLGFIDGILGFVLGAFEAVLVVGFLVMLLENQSIVNVQSYIKESIVCSKYVSPFFDSIVGLVKQAI